MFSSFMDMGRPLGRAASAINDFESRNRKILGNLQDASDAEFEALRAEFSEILTNDELIRLCDVESKQRAMYVNIQQALKNEKDRRYRLIQDERLHRKNTAIGLQILLEEMSDNGRPDGTVANAASIPLNMADVLGDEPVPAPRVTKSVAAGMSDAELAQAMAEAREQAQTTMPRWVNADYIEASMDYATQIVAELRRRSPIVDKMRSVADANLETLQAEQDARKAMRDSARAENDRVKSNMVDAIIDLQRQIAELRVK